MSSVGQLLKHMHKEKNNVSIVVKEDLCLGCGICQDMCPQKCIFIEHGVLNRPHINGNKCVNCGICVKTCPGKGIEIKNLSDNLYSKDAKYDKYLGYVHKCFATYSMDNEIRYHSASGGSVSQFLIYLLESRIIDGAVVVGFCNESPMKPRVFVAKTREEILSAKSSKYCVVSYDGILRVIEENEGKFAVVGLPCHIHAFRNVAKQSKKLRKSVIGYFSIYCSASKNMLSQDYYLWRYGVDQSKLSRFSYRDNGCLGSMVFEDRKGNKIVNDIPLLTYYSSAKGFFTPSRCMLCVDHFGELADVCFGDIHVGDFAKDAIGINSVISRSPYWSEMLSDCSRKGELYVAEIDENTVLSSQVFCLKQKKGPGVVAEYLIRKYLHKSVPEYDISFIVRKPGVKDVVKVFLRIIMRYIGNHRRLWWIIRWLDGGKKWI